MKRLLLYILPLMVLLVACSKDRGNNTGGEEETEDPDTSLSFVVTLPNQAQPTPGSSYALNATDEDNVSAINVLVFKENGANMELADWAEAIPGTIENSGGAGVTNKKKFEIRFSKIVKNSGNYQFVIIANAKAEVDALFTFHGVDVNAPKAATLEKLKLTGVTKWNSVPGSGGYRDIPMWGESVKRIVVEDMTIADVMLLRMVAKINVTVDATTGVRSNFKLKTVSLRNAYQNGYIVPDENHIDPVTKNKVTKATPLAPRSLAAVEYVATSETEMLETIYTFESDVPKNAGVVETDKSTCLVLGAAVIIGGIEKLTYYRVDIAEEDAIGGVSYLEILRNHNYKINVKKILAYGHGTAQEAVDAGQSNIVVNIEAMDAGSLNTIEFNEQHLLAVSTSELTLYRDGNGAIGAPAKLSVYTNNPNGWYVDPNNKSSWLTIIADRDNSGGVLTIDITATPMAVTNPSQREGFFIITTGTLSITIKVAQINEESMNLAVDTELIIFPKTPTGSKSFTVSRNPASMATTISHVGDITWEPSFAPPATVTGGVMTIQPTENNTAGMLQSIITLTATHNGRTIIKTIVVRQMSIN